MKQKGFAPIIILVLIALAVVGYFGYKNYWPKLQTLVVSPTPTATDDPTANWKTYTNTAYGFSFKYPSDLKVEQMGTSPYEQYKLVYMGKKQGDSGRTQTSLFDGYVFYVSSRGTDSVDKVAQDTFNGSKENCYEQTKWSNITTSTLGGRASKTYSVTNCLGDYTENFVSNGKNTFEITQIYIGGSPEYSQYKSITNQILSTFKFTDSKISDIPQPISSFFAEINKNFNLNLVPIAENEFYSPTGMITKKSWKLDFTNTTVGKSLTSFLLKNLRPNNEGGDIGGGGVAGYENDLIKCSNSYGYRGGGPTNWTDPFNYLTCTEK